MLGRALAIAMAGLLPGAAMAQSVNAKALEEINDFASSFCGDYYREGSSKQFGAEGAAQAELDGLLKKLTNIGVKGAAAFDSKSYVGVLQGELGDELKSVRDCRLKIWNDLKGAVIEAGPAPAALGPGQPSSRQPTSLQPSSLPPKPAASAEQGALYPFTATRQLTAADLAGFNKDQLRLMRNEIYARYGYSFQSADLRDTFGRMPWYRPRTTDAEAVFQSMSTLERANVLAIKEAEQTR